MTLAGSSNGTDRPGLAWIPRAAGEGHVPVLMLPRASRAGWLLLYFHGNRVRTWRSYYPCSVGSGTSAPAHVVYSGCPGYGVSSSGGTTCEAQVGRTVI